MTAAELKASILDLAIRGKLVAQDPDDEPASELLARIAGEKARLIKEKKIKKEKPLAPIDESEVPFALPKGWAWCKLGSVMNIVSARRVHQSDWKSSGVPFYRAREIVRLAETGSADNDLYITEELFDEFSKSGCPKPGDLMVTAVGTIGTCYVVKTGDRFYYKDATVLCFENYGGISAEYVLHLMHSPYMQEVMHENSAGTTVDTITMVRANEYLMPLPPLAEQKRIVEKVEELMPLVERYEKAEAKRIELEKALPGDLEKSILQEAIQGKLVEQDPKDEPASELLARIAAEKAKLIKEKKIKKEKPLAPIDESEVPFALPKGWAWCRLGEICEVVMGQSPDGSSINKYDGVEFHQGKICFSDYEIAVSREKTLSPTKIVPPDSVLLCVRAPVGKVNVTSRRICIGRGLCALVPKGGMLPRFLFTWLQPYEAVFNAQATGSTFKAISKEIVLNQIVPLPPLAEQKRIVAKVDELLGALKRLH